MSFLAVFSFQIKELYQLMGLMNIHELTAVSAAGSFNRLTTKFKPIPPTTS